MSEEEIPDLAQRIADIVQHNNSQHWILRNWTALVGIVGFVIMGAFFYNDFDHHKSSDGHKASMVRLQALERSVDSLHTEMRPMQNHLSGTPDIHQTQAQKVALMLESLAPINKALTALQFEQQYAAKQMAEITSKLETIVASLSDKTD